MDTPFANAGIERGMEIMRLLGIDALSIKNPEVFKKYDEISSYLSKYANGLHVARMVTAGSGVHDKMDKLWQYVQLRKQLDEKQREIDALAPELNEERDKAEGERLSLVSELTMYER